MSDPRNEWISSGDTGESSKEIWRVLMGLSVRKPGNIPMDSGDFGRCYRLIKKVPEWKDRLGEVAIALPIWGPLIREWDKLEKAYETDKGKCYDLISALREECMIAGGWEKTGKHSWKFKRV